MLSSKLHRCKKNRKASSGIVRSVKKCNKTTGCNTLRIQTPPVARIVDIIPVLAHTWILRDTEMFSPRKKWIDMFSPSISQTNWSWSQPFKASFNHHLAEVRSISFLLLLPEKSNFLISKSTGQNPYHSHSSRDSPFFRENTS